MSKYEIVAEPFHNLVTEGTTISYRVERTMADAPDPSHCNCCWFVVNDPYSRVSNRGSLPERVAGPSGERLTQWKNARWTIPGNHLVICRVIHGGGSCDVMYLQPVVSLKEELAAGPILPQHRHDGRALLAHHAEVKRQIVFMEELEQIARTVESRQDDAKAEMEGWQRHKERLEYLIAGVRNAISTHEIRAEHIDSSRGLRTELRVFAAKLSGSWVVCDWTDASDDRTSAVYSGTEFGHALSAWREGSKRYPAGGISYSYPIPDKRRRTGRFETTGESWTEQVINVLTITGLVVGIAGFALLPIPGSQAAAFFLASMVFSGTAAAISIHDRHSRGVEDVRADALDALTIASGLLGGIASAGTTAWRVGGRVLLPLGGRTVAHVLIADLTLAGVQGVLVAQDRLKEFRAVAADGTRTPHERTTEMLRLVAVGVVEASLLYVNYRSTRSQLSASKHIGGSDARSPEQRVKALRDPETEIDATEPPRVKGDSRSGEHETRVHVDSQPELHTLHFAHRTAPDADLFGLPPSLQIPIGVRSIDDLKEYVGEIVRTNDKRTAFLVQRHGWRAGPTNDAPLWSQAEAKQFARRLNPEQEVWVHVDEKNYREIYRGMTGARLEYGDVLDHVMNRIAVRSRNYDFPFVRLQPVSRGTNSSSGTGVEGIEQNTAHSLAQKGFVIPGNVRYADPADLTKMLDIQIGRTTDGTVTGLRDMMDFFRWDWYKGPLAQGSP